jgi:WD40 repeat protein
MIKKNFLIFLFMILYQSIYGQQTELTFQTGHVAAISKIVFSPDGSFLASSDDQHKVCIWDMTTLNQMASFYYSGLEEDEHISLLSFSPDNKILVAGTATGKLLIWDIERSVPLSSLATGIEINDMCFFRLNEVFLLSSKLMLLDITDNSITEIFNERIADLSHENGSDDFSFCTFNGNFGRISSSTGSVAIVQDSVINDLKKQLSKRNSGISGMKIGSSSLMAYGSFNLKFFTFPGRNKVFSASMPYMDEKITGTGYIPSGDYFIVSNTDGKIYVFDFKTNKLIKVLKDHVSAVNSLAVHPLRNIFASGSADRSIILWDANTFKPLKRFYARASSIESLELDSEDHLLAFGNELGYTKMLKLNDKYPEVKSVKNHRQRVTDLVFVNGGKNLITSSDDNHLSKIGTDKFKVEEYRKFRKNFGFKFVLAAILEKLNLYVDPMVFIDSISVTNDKKYIAADGYKMKRKTIKVMSPNGSKRKRRQSIMYKKQFEYYYSSSDLKKLNLYQPEFSENRSVLPIDSVIMGVDVYNKVNGHISTVTGAVYDKAYNRIITSSLDATIKIWDIDTKKLVITIIPIDKDKRIFITADNYYFAPKNSLDAIGFKQGISYYPLEQFDLKFNRPDIVLKNLKNPDSLLVKIYYNAYEKRLKKAGFSDEMFTAEWHTPDMQIINADDFGYMTDKSTIDLKIYGSDNKYKLDRINVWINDVPLYGINGISLRAESTDSIVKTLTIPLSNGNNRIQVSCMNEKGVESLKRSVDISYENRVSKKPDLYIIAMSVSKYEDERYDLQYAVKDGRDIAGMFDSQSFRRENYDKVHIDTLFNNMATRENFFRLKNELIKSKPDDQIIVFVSGHGLLNKDLDFYFATYDIDFSKPETKGISFDDMEHLLDSVPARKKLMMMDACHSGEVDKAEPLNFVAQNITPTADITFRGNIKEYDFKGASNNAAQSGTNLNNTFDIMQELFAGLDKGTGTVVISAAAGKGYALESSKWNNGVFTYSIINGLKNRAADKNNDKHITISELKDYSVVQVEQLTGGNQKPTARREGIGVDWRIW